MRGQTPSQSSPCWQRTPRPAGGRRGRGPGRGRWRHGPMREEHSGHVTSSPPTRAHLVNMPRVWLWLPSAETAWGGCWPAPTTGRHCRWPPGPCTQYKGMCLHNCSLELQKKVLEDFRFHNHGEGPY